jgi:hypothetical protein
VILANEGLTTDGEKENTADWQVATVGWLSNPDSFSPINLPVMRVPSSKSGGVYDSPEQYFDTIEKLWVVSFTSFCFR